MIAEVLIPRPVYQAYTYKIPKAYQEIVRSGLRVEVPFGASQVIGLVSKVLQEDDESLKLKEISSIFEDINFVDQDQIEMIYWMSNYYMMPLGEVASLFLPKYFQKVKEVYSLVTPIDQLLEQIPNRRKVLRQALIRLSLSNKSHLDRDQLIAFGLSKALSGECIKNLWLEPRAEYLSSSDNYAALKKKATFLN
jgi:primosomal protein N'